VPGAHRYESRLEWSGSTGAGWKAYSRAHSVTSPPSEQPLRLSSDPAFAGDPALLNPEQLQVIAASSCQLLSFLAVVARARIDVVGYEDEAEGVMPEDESPMWITKIVLRPRIKVAGEVDEERLRHYVELAHEHCFIANSLRSEVEVEPEFELV
jgi:organic hydroperoxide reductase OsmC/OhrA